MDKLRSNARDVALPDLARIRTFLSAGLFCVAFVAHPAGAAGIVVTSTSSRINGDVSSPAALQATPGPDGISVAEAVAAANNAAEPQTITFADALAGQTIALTFPLVVTRDGTTLTGLTSPEGNPTLTLDGREAHQFNGVLYVLASYVTVSGLRFVGHDLDAVSVLAGNNPNATPDHPDQPRPRQQVRNVVIENNTFGDNEGAPARGSAARVYMEPQGRSVDASIETVRIIGNTFLRSAGGVGVNVAVNGYNCLIRDVVIENNTFAPNSIAIESAHGSDNQLLDTRVLHNTFAGASPGAALFIAHLVDPPPDTGNSASRNVIDRTVVDSNLFLGTTVLILGGQLEATGCTVSNIEFVNNVMDAGTISIIGGKWDATGNRVTGLRFVNNTLLAEVCAFDNIENGSNNSVSDVTFRNTIFLPGGYCSQRFAPDAVSYCLLEEASGFSGDGNIFGAPRFVDRAQRDFHLLADSPAVDAGTGNGAPATDIECRPRLGFPDIGAYEFGAPTVARLFLNVGHGSGSVDPSPTGLECGSARSFVTGSIVKLTASPSPGWRFAGWSGDPDCLDGTVTMAADRRCVAAFAAVRRRAVRRSN